MKDETVDKGIEDAVTFITFQQDNNPRCRGPFLAQMELQSRLIARRDPKADESELLTLIINYFKNFGTKQCAAMDLKLFLGTVEREDADKFFDDTHKMIEFDESSAPKDIYQIHRHVCWYQLQRFLGKHTVFGMLIQH